MDINKIYQGDALSVLQTFPDNSIDMCMTSPPYWGLRDYGVEQIFGGDADCKHEWGEIRRTLNHKSGETNPGKESWFKDKGASEDKGNCFCSKCGAWKGQLGLEPTPEMYIKHMTEIFHEVKRVLKKEGTLWVVIGDTYNAQPAGNKEPNKFMEQVHQSARENTNDPKRSTSSSKFKSGLKPKCLCMIPERLAWSMIQDGWILRNKNIWYKHNGMPSSVQDRFSNKYEFVYMFSQSQRYYFDLDAVREKTIWHGEQWGNAGKKLKDANLISNHEFKDNPAGKNPGDVFEINTQPFPEAHFAVYPVKLCEKPIKAGCPKGGIVLDPFSGAGTTCYTAAKLGRDFIGIEISEEYKAMSEDRIFGPLFKPTRRVK